MSIVNAIIYTPQSIVNDKGNDTHRRTSPHHLTFHTNNTHTHTKTVFHFSVSKTILHTPDHDNI